MQIFVYKKIKQVIQTSLLTMINLPVLFVLIMLSTLFIFFPLFYAGAEVTIKSPKHYIKNNKQTPQKLVSINLCSDRLLVELAEPAQISSLSILAKDDILMLKKIDTDSFNVYFNHKKINELIPFMDSKILINKTYYYKFYKHLQQLGFDVFGFNVPQNKSDLIRLIWDIADITGHPDKAKKLISQLETNIKPINKSILVFGEKGTVYNSSNASNIGDMLELLGAKNSVENIKLPDNDKISIEKLISIKTDVILQSKYSNDYSISSQIFNHPALKSVMKDIPSTFIPSKYSICLDHGIWQGANYINEKLME